ncbi:MAG: hypothetical protein KGM44_10680 [bacterium]|nr:hypothetical protein [bacterium]
MIEITRERAPKPARDVVYGIYRDGDNNLDHVQAATVADAQRASKNNPNIAFAVENTTHEGARGNGALHTEDGVILHGDARWSSRDAANMASPQELARFVERTLETAHTRGGQQSVWIELVDHGGGDGGGLEADSTHGMMSMPAMAQAIAAGTQAYNKLHPDDTRKVEGVVANQCLMSTLGFAEELSRAGVKYLAASPETMIAPGVPSGAVAQAVQQGGDPQSLAHGIVDAVMDRSYGVDGMPYRPAAAFNVLDLAPEKIAAMERAVRAVNDDIAALPRDAGGDLAAHAVDKDGAHVPGMTRFVEDHGLPWRADRPAEALYNRLADDARLPQRLRQDAAAAAQAVDGMVLADRETSHFEPGDVSYRDAAGPTVHFPVNPRQYDAWAKNGISETDNHFYKAVDGRDAAQRLGAVA